MDPNLTREQKMIVKNIKEFMKKEIAPVAEEMDRDAVLPNGIWQTMGDIGILGLDVDEVYGGSGMDRFTFTLVLEQMARVCPGLALSVGANTNLCAHNITHNATESQKKKYLPDLCTGEKIGCLGLTEPGAGSDAVGIQTTADADGDHFVLNGTKTFITNGPIADVALVYAKTDPEKGAHGITAFILEKGMPGFSAGSKIDKMGHRCSPTSELYFNNCRVPKENVLGQINNGIHVMMTGLDSERAIFSGIPLGNAEAAMELALSYSKSRQQFDRPISNFQQVKAKLANMYADIEAARGLVYRTARLADQSARGGKGTDFHKLAAANLLFVAGVNRRAVDESLQIHGGYGFTTEYPINRFYRDAKLMELGAGTMEVRRLVVADELIKRGTGYV